VGVCNQTTLLILNYVYISSELVTLLKSINVLLRVSDILGLAGSLKFINFSFQACLIFVPKMAASFPSYIV